MAREAVFKLLTWDVTISRQLPVRPAVISERHGFLGVIGLFFLCWPVIDWLAMSSLQGETFCAGEGVMSLWVVWFVCERHRQIYSKPAVSSVTSKE